MKNRLTPAEAESLVLKWDAYARRLADRWWRRVRWADFDDLHSEVRMGFLHAARKFDPSRGVRFSTYATWWGNQYARRFALREHARGVKVPHHLGWVDVPVYSLSADPDADNPELLLGDLAAEDPPRDCVVPSDFWAAVRRLLTPRRAEAVELYYRDGLTMAEIAGRWGVTRSAVQIALDLARKRLAKALPCAYRG